MATLRAAACTAQLAAPRQQQQRARQLAFVGPVAAQTASRTRHPAAAAAASWGVGLAAAAVLLGAPDAHALDTVTVFTQSCAGCHSGGGNVIKRDATLQLGDLQKYGLDSQEGLVQIIYRGKGSMPGYGADCTPKGKCTFGPRLSGEDIRDLAAYVLAQAQQGWQQ